MTEKQPTDNVQPTKIRIKLKSYESKILDDTLLKIKNTVERSGAKLVGPVLLPTRIRKYTVLRSVHADKKSREQFESRTHYRLIDIVEPLPKTVDELMKMELPASVEIEVKM